MNYSQKSYFTILNDLSKSLVRKSKTEKPIFLIFII